MIQDTFLEPEVRDGFYIPSAIKQAWAAELKVLGEIDRICKKYEIPYFADWGTLLGAVRHKGFIPWDDDLDIAMKRADYLRFLQVAPQELPEEYEVFTYETHPDFWSFLARVVAKKRICFEEAHLREFYGFPYIVGIDIFVLDNVAEDVARNEERNAAARYVIAVAEQLGEGTLAGDAAEDALHQIENALDVSLDRTTDLHGLRVQLYRLAEQLFAMFSDAESAELTRMMPDELYGKKKLRLSQTYYDRQVWLPFEKIMLPVPCGYDEMLRKRYGDYMRLVRDAGGHDYPFFETQKNQLQAVLDFDMPGYRYGGVAVRDKAQGRSGSLKCLVKQKYEELKRYYELLVQQGEADMELLAASQQAAIDMGTLIEQCKGEGHLTVAVLERYCEQVFGLSVEFGKTVLAQMEGTLVALRDSIQREILERTEVVFLPYQASQWEYIKSVWEAAMQDEMCDVYVVPIPYFYKDYDGSLRDMQYEAMLFPKEVEVVDYEMFDFTLHYPEVIYTQNPYDAYDDVISVEPAFYSSNLVNYTEKLVYIPPFVLEEFSKESYRAYHNMQYYCTRPGVINADKVIVQSENMRKLYVEKLTEFAGEDTRALWEQKVVGLGSPKADVQSGHERGEVVLPDAWRPYAERVDKSRKKIVLYYVSLSSFQQYGEQAFEKMRMVFDVFSKNSADVMLVWKPQALIKPTLEQSNPALYLKYCLLEEEFKQMNGGILDETLTDEAVVAACDAYYGDSSAMVQMCRNMGKPVMLWDVASR